MTGCVVYARTSTDDLQGATAKAMEAHADSREGAAIVTALGMPPLEYERRLPDAPLALGHSGKESFRP